jgi:hypothetical protein
MDVQMHNLNASEMSQLEGGGFWAGLACGGLIMATIGLAIVPDPTTLTKQAAWFSGVAAVAACGIALS